MSRPKKSKSDVETGGGSSSISTDTGGGGINRHVLFTFQM